MDDSCFYCTWAKLRTPCDHCLCERAGDLDIPCECEEPYWVERRWARRTVEISRWESDGGLVAEPEYYG